MIWYWTGQHQNQLIHGRVTASTSTQAYQWLRHICVQPFSVRREHSVERIFRQALFRRQQPLLLRKLSMLLRAGMSPSEALQHLSADAPKTLAEALQQIVLEINAGAGLRRAFAHADMTDPALNATLGAAELSGNLAQVVGSLAHMQERRAQLMSALTSSFTYPLILLAMGFGLCVLTLQLLVPVYRDLYAGSSDLPESTRILLAVSDLSNQPWFWVAFAGAVFALIWVVKRLLKKRRFHSLLMRVPVLGELLRCALLAHTLHLLSGLSAHGVELHGAIEVCRAQARNPLLLGLLKHALDNLEQGSELSDVFGYSGMGSDLPALLSMAGRSADLPAALQLGADYYSDRLTLASNRLRALLEPVLISLIGVVIGGILMALYLPLFSLGQAL